MSSEIDRIYKKFDFQWEVLDVIIGGKSIIDTNQGLTGIPLRTIEDADRFMLSYGFDLDDPIEQAELLGNFKEALNLIRKNFLRPDNSEGLALEIPRKILELTDMRELLLMASMSYPGQMADTQGHGLRDWSCAILKVVHTIAHIDKDIRYTYFKEIQKQIFDRFYKIVHRDSEEKLYIGAEPDDPHRVNLVAFESKPKKSRDSILLKLLHKPESVADEIFDHVGLRFITNTRLDALRVVKYLKDMMVVMPANIKPSRSRNNLIDLPVLKQGLKEILAGAETGGLGEREVTERLTEMTVLPQVRTDNPHSSEHYRAIQFTGRQLIKLKNPIFEQVRELKSLAKKESASGDLSRTIERLDLGYLQREVRFFYPFEIQVIDQKSHEENEEGLSAHSEYKKSQTMTAMNRVMGALVRSE